MTKKDRFRKALKGLLDEVGLSTRSKWAFVLGVTREEIEDWVEGRSFPSADHLRSIWEILNYFNTPNKAPLEVFGDLLGMKIGEISSCLPIVDERSGLLHPVEEETLASFITLPKLGDFLELLRVLPHNLQKEVLNDAMASLRLCIAKK